MGKPSSSVVDLNGELLPYESRRMLEYLQERALTLTTSDTLGAHKDCSSRVENTELIEQEVFDA